MKLNTIVCKDGGILRELYKSKEFGQVSVRIIPPGESSEGSLHLRKDEKWWVAMGAALILLEFPNGTKQSLSIDGPSTWIIEVPARTGHRIVNRGSGDVVLVWHSSEVYDPENPDRYAWG